MTVVGVLLPMRIDFIDALVYSVHHRRVDVLEPFGAKCVVARVLENERIG